MATPTDVDQGLIDIAMGWKSTPDVAKISNVRVDFIEPYTTAGGT